jgi:hypothetical protein
MSVAPNSPAAQSAAIPQGAAQAARAVLPAIAEASRRTGVAFDALFNTARLESGFNPDARARTSSATGLFQFIDSTWLSTLSRHGSRHGLAPASREEALGLRRDPLAASLMAAAHMADNAQALEAKLGRPAGTVDLYLAHFLGAGGAARFLDRLSAEPDAPAARLLPEAARANRAVFYADGAPRSLRQVHDLFARKLGAGPTPATSPNGGPQGAAPVWAERLPDAADQPVEGSALSAPQAVQAARLAYLLLADMGA